MSLDFLVKEAKKNGSFKPAPSLNNFIDATDSESVKRHNLIKRSADLRQYDIPWNKCKHLKSLNGTDHCQKYLSYCAKEKCKPEWKE
jgi:hypothetical protein